MHGPFALGAPYPTLPCPFAGLVLRYGKQCSGSRCSDMHQGLQCFVEVTVAGKDLGDEG